MTSISSLCHKNTTTNVAIKKKNIQVAVRARPMSENGTILCCDTTKLITLKCGNQSDRYAQGQRTFGPFDKVFGPETSQIEIYKDIVSPLIKEVINGYNCTVFAYGQTGSGKTYTMEGPHTDADSGDYSWESDPTSGIIPRALHQIFTELGSDKEIDFTVRVSYVELYNENIYDLLSMSANQSESLDIYDDKNKGVSIPGAEEVIVRSRNEVYELLKLGAEKRRTAATMLNISSSRSHSVFTISVMIRESGLGNGEELLRQGKLNLVDLAGSENIGRSGATDKRAREAGNINVSLLALGRVITALTKDAPHIPYRESKLTRILKDSLGGKTITTIIATISPDVSTFEESVNTLEYAQRAKNIKNNPEINKRISRSDQILYLQFKEAIVDKLKEVEEYAQMEKIEFNQTNKQVMEEFEKQIAHLKDKNDKLLEDNRTFEEKLKEAEEKKKMDKSNAKEREFENEIFELNEENVGLKTQNEIMTNSLAEINRKMNEMQQEMNVLAKENANLKEQQSLQTKTININDMQMEEIIPANHEEKDGLGSELAAKQYRLLRIVKSVKELDEFRYENYCQYGKSKPSQFFKSCAMPCINKKIGKTCDFELMALPSADLESGKIHIYAHSQHSNHPLKRRKRRGSYRVKKRKMIPDANPPTINRTQQKDDIEYEEQETDEEEEGEEEAKEVEK